MKLLSMIKFMIVFVIFLTATGLYGQNAYSEEKQKAKEHIQAKQWNKAASLYQKITENNPEDGEAWFQYGYSLHAMKKYSSAISAYKKAEKYGYAPTFTRYNLACAYALEGDKDMAFNWLVKANQAGFGNTELLKTDADLEILRDDSRFAGILKSADKNANPCEYMKEWRQLDFWLGEWNVYSKSGNLVGTNTISKDLNGCVIFENWQGSTGIEGKSMNYYSPEDRKWYQQWVSERGNIIRYEGSFTSGAIQLKGESITKDGKISLSRMTLTPTPDGKVSQVIEQSDDNGESWYIWFDGTYVRKDSLSAQK